MQVHLIRPWWLLGFLPLFFASLVLEPQIHKKSLGLYL